jgi:hypothetical protein
MGELLNFVRERVCYGVPELIIGAPAASTSPSRSCDDG